MALRGKGDVNMLTSSQGVNGGHYYQSQQYYPQQVTNSGLVMMNSHQPNGSQKRSMPAEFNNSTQPQQKRVTGVPNSRFPSVVPLDLSSLQRDPSTLSL